MYLDIAGIVMLRDFGNLICYLVWILSVYVCDSLMTSVVTCLRSVHVHWLPTDQGRTEVKFLTIVYVCWYDMCQYVNNTSAHLVMPINNHKPTLMLSEVAINIRYTCWSIPAPPLLTARECLTYVVTQGDPSIL